ncbi:hypothetical protein TRFO_05824 [Tritrichomonas foetus]|uniref:Initiator binding domain-containing protein n=1 Tax=Tritrichomonas foetus TaxID=1144522 RepID=A0A1J4K8D0_9EUKA|nr:hypothetical protein TRFO_05824 [Tritrichomonas foetus]|eukprot:OHT05685.1 hypothetical protein TRFO_05824 [Tritrichomonas foetus]
MAEEQKLETPEYFDYLTDEEKEQYHMLQKNVGAPENRYTRNRRLATLRESFEEIRKFCIRNDENDWKRCMVCGICWFNNNIAINIRQLRMIINKSKSTINGALAKMGYVTVPTKGDDANELISTIPYLDGKYFEMRQWTIRKMKGKPEDEEEQKKMLSSEEEKQFYSFMEENENFNNIESVDFDVNFEEPEFWFNDFSFTHDAQEIDFNNKFGFNLSTHYEVNTVRIKSESNKYISYYSDKSSDKSDTTFETNIENILEFSKMSQFSKICNQDTCAKLLAGFFKMNVSMLSFYYFLPIAYLKFIAMCAYQALLAGARVPRISY